MNNERCEIYNTGWSRMAPSGPLPCSTGSWSGSYAIYLVASLRAPFGDPGQARNPQIDGDDLMAIGQMQSVMFGADYRRRIQHPARDRGTLAQCKQLRPHSRWVHPSSKLPLGKAAVGAR
jgi:hypothetical protein